MKKVLILAYFYPPGGGAGVQRTVKFVKYLPEFGFEPIVVAGTGGQFAFSADAELAKEVVHVKRRDIRFSRRQDSVNRVLKGAIGRWTRTSMQAWISAARRTVEKTIEEEKPDILFVTTSPFPAAGVIASVSRKYNIPWVLDMRDPWALDPITQYPSKLHYRLELQDMKRACQKADAVIMNTPSAFQAAINTFGEIDKTKFHCITNGWDREDFEGRQAGDRLTNSPMKIVHTGLFHTRGAERNNKRHLLTSLRYSISPINLLTRSPYYLFAAYRKLVEQKLIQPDTVRFIFAGAATPDDKQLAETFRVAEFTEFRGYLNHEKSVELLYEADVLFLPLHDLDDGQDPLIVPGKTYEYLAARRSILACVPKGDARDFVLKSGLGCVCNPSDIGQISKTLLKLVKQHKTLESTQTIPNNEFIEQFQRRILTQQLAEIFNAVLNASNKL